MKLLYGTPLKRFLRDWRRANPITTDIAVILQSVSYPVNVGSLFRIADAVRVTELILCGATPTPPNSTITKVGRDKHNDVKWTYEEKVEVPILRLRAESYHICALELTDESKPYFKMSSPDKICLVLGNEDHGVTKATLNLCDSSVFVPMYGHGRSLNVHVSAAIVLYYLRHSPPAGG